MVPPLLTHDTRASFGGVRWPPLLRQVLRWVFLSAVTVAFSPIVALLPLPVVARFRALIANLYQPDLCDLCQSDSPRL